jgi:hypothetical protein
LILLALAPACTPPVERMPIAELLSASPPDGTSNVGALKIRVAVLDSVVTPGLNELGAGATLVTWPDLSPVETTTSFVGGGENVTGFELAAAGALPAGWYAALLPRPPAGLGLAVSTIEPLPDGRLVVRVNPGSAPALWSLGVCAESEGSTLVNLMFSEVVHTATTSTMPLAVSAGPAASPAPCSTTDVPLADRPLQFYPYRCPLRLGAKDVVSIALGPGLVSESGAEVPAASRLVALEGVALERLADCAPIVIGP